MSNNLRPEDDLGLAGKVAIVTGGGVPDDGIGNGRAAALLLARSGAKVMVVDIVSEAAKQTVSMIATEGGIAAPFVADVANEIQCKGLIDATIKEFGRLDLLDNNVGIGGRGTVVDTPVVNGTGSCRSMSTACSLFRGMRSRPWWRRPRVVRSSMCPRFRHLGRTV